MGTVRTPFTAGAQRTGKRMADNDDLTASLKTAGYDFDDVRDRQALARIVGCRPDDLAALTARLKQVQMLALNEWLG